MGGPCRDPLQHAQGHLAVAQLPGGLVDPGGQRRPELALGEVPGRIYIVELTGPIEDDPNLTDKKFPDNPAKSYANEIRFWSLVRSWIGRVTPRRR